jgi:hypothetical protein
MSFHAGAEFSLIAPHDNRVDQPITAAIGKRPTKNRLLTVILWSYYRKLWI